MILILWHGHIFREYESFSKANTAYKWYKRFLCERFLEIKCEEKNT